MRSEENDAERRREAANGVSHPQDLVSVDDDADLGV